MAEGDAKGGSPSLNLNTLLALFTLAGSVWFVSQKLTSDRPVIPAGTGRPFVGEQTLEARLWEDPFKSGDRNNSRNAAPIATNFDAVVEQIWERTNSGNGLLILPVMVSGGHYSEDKESRIRSRFAIVSALSRSGYAPEDAEHLGVLKIPWPTQQEVSKAKRITDRVLTSLWSPSRVAGTNGCEGCPVHLFPFGSPTTFEMEVRYEWYRPRTFFPQPQSVSIRPNVLVLWLDDSFFEDDPLLRLPLLLEPLGITNSLLAVSLIGPRRSSTLRAMLPGKLAGARHLENANSNLWNLSTNLLRRVEIFCATPSAMDEVLVEESSAIPRETVGRALVTNGFRAFHNLASTDSQLAAEVLDELALRNTDVVSNRNNHLVLISEWDTFYARMLALTYGTEMAVRQKGKAIDRGEFVRRYLTNDMHARFPSNFHSLVYLRGLDGQTIGDQRKDDGGPATKTPTTSFEELRQWIPDVNKAEGQAQFDYLSRLGDQLEELESRLRGQNRRVKMVVGIVGSDVYDTLLILQALRERFDNFLFFTTDLDARFWHPREKSWSRNLIVASGYGLKLHPDLQGAIAPFRDSTQTAQFAAALAALAHPDLSRLTQVPPRRFEIGNDGPVDLSVQSSRLLAGSPAPASTNELWLHPLTAYETARASGEMSWARAMELFPRPFGREGKMSPPPVASLTGRPDLEREMVASSGANARTRWDPVVQSLHGLGLIVLLGCIFWRPLRARTLHALGYLRETLTYRRCDVGDADEIAILAKGMLDDERDQADYRSGTAAPRPVEARRGEALAAAAVSAGASEAGAASPNGNPTGQTPAPSSGEGPKAPEAGAPLEAAPSMRSRLSTDACAFVRFLNQLLRGDYEATSELKKRFLVRTSPPPGWRDRWTLKRWQNRRHLDGILDELRRKPPGESQWSASASARAATRKLFLLQCWDLAGFWFATLFVAWLSWKVGADIMRDGLARGTEPFSLTNGVSGWPAVLLRLVAVVLSVIFCSTLYSRMQVMFHELTRCYRFALPLERPEEDRSPVTWKARVARMRTWARDHWFPLRDDAISESGLVCAGELWRRYHRAGHWGARLCRVIVPVTLYYLLAGVIYQLFGSPFQPLRGNPNDAIFEWSRFHLSEGPIRGYMVVNLSFFFLTFLTIDAAWLCRRFIERLSAGRVAYPRATREHFGRRHGNVPAECLDEWIGIRLVADLTDRVGRLLWFPSVVLLILLIARTSWWDNWPWHAGHTIIMLLNFCIALASVIILQRAAGAAKRAAEDRLMAKVKMLRAQTAESAAANEASQAEKLLDDIRGIHHGAFASIWENPVFGALMVGPGGLTILQMGIWFLNR